MRAEATSGLLHLSVAANGGDSLIACFIPVRYMYCSLRLFVANQKGMLEKLQFDLMLLSHFTATVVHAALR